jgi:hypothetical protein
MRRVAFVVGVIVLGALAFAACTPRGLPPEQVQAWVGRPATDLVKDWGAPTREVEDAGQRVLVYEETERANTPNFQHGVTKSQAGSAAAQAAARDAALGPTVYARSYLFWVDGGGAIVRAQIRQP